jgi:hypothetical protein
MKKLSQSEEMSRHTARESSRKPDHAPPLTTASLGAQATSAIHLAGQTFRRAIPVIKPFTKFLFFAALGALATGIVSHFAVVVPLEKNVLSAEARSLATELDSAVRMRSSLISITAGNSELDAFLESGGLDKMLSALRKQFPDFLSIEATNDRGQVQAMGGDLPLSQAGLFSKGSTGQTSRVNLGIQRNKGIFHDDPENNCFFITCKHVGADGGKWFTRSRFSRESVVAIMKSIPTRRVALVPITGASKDVLEGQISLSMPQSCVVRTIGSWWRGPGGAEALLTMPGWLMRMEDTAARPILWRAPIAVPLCLVLCTVLAGIIMKQAGLRGDEKPLRVGKIGSPLKSEGEHGKNAAGTQPLDSTSQEDLPCLTKLVTVPGHNSRIGVADTLGKESGCACCGENEPVPETLEVCWSEPSEHCETGNTPHEEKIEGARLSDEEINPGSERTPAHGQLVSISG